MSGSALPTAASDADIEVSADHPGPVQAHAAVEVALLSDLRERTPPLKVICVDDSEYHLERAVWNGDINRRPFCIVKCGNVHDVVAAVRACQKNRVAATVRGGGHSVSGLSIADGAVLIDVCDRSVQLADDASCVTVGGGAVWADVDAVTSTAGVYVPAGLISHTGVAGLTLGGGIGWLSRTRGLTVDSLIEIEMVTAAGEVIGASETAHEDLFWGVRGGGSGLGIVTKFTFRTHRVGAVSLFECHFPPDRTAELLKNYAQESSEAPDNVSMYCFATAETLILVVAVFNSDACTEETIDHIRAWGPLGYVATECTLSEINQRYDYANRHGRGYHWSRSSFLQSGDMTASTADTISEFIRGCPKEVTVQISPLGGAISQKPLRATAFSNRSAVHEVHALAVWDSPFRPTVAVDAVRRLPSLLELHGATCGYVNIVPGDSDEWLIQAFGNDGAAKLKQLKRHLDPKNFFSHSLLGRMADIGPWVFLNMTPKSIPPLTGVNCPPPNPPPLPPSLLKSVRSGFDAAKEALKGRLATLQDLVSNKLAGLRPSPRRISSPVNQGSIYICDECHQVIAEDPPPYGTSTPRYHCSECAGFDLCKSCFFATNHRHHMWLEVAPKARQARGESVASILLASFENYRHRWCCGTESDDGFIWKTFGDMRSRIEQVMFGLRHYLDIEPRTRVGICGPNCEDWMVIDMTLLLMNCMSVPLDYTATSSALLFAIQRAEITVIICSPSCADRLKQIAFDCPLLTLMVIGRFDDRKYQFQSSALDIPPHTNVDSLDAVEQFGCAAEQLDQLLVEASASDVLTVIFTSGSTGQPKGIQLTDRTLAARVSSVVFPPDPCVIVAYMPLCHSFERLNVLTHFVAGGRVAFHHGPVSDILRTCQIIRPTSFASTPRLWNVLYQDFNTALGTTSREAVLRDFGARLGNRTRYISTGGAFTRPEVVDFLRECFGCSVVDGFGTTETGGLLWDGKPGSNVKTKLVDCSELGYLTSDHPRPRGELCVSSTTMSSEGYLGDPDATEAAFFTDSAGIRWYRTGDICEEQAHGVLTVIDRKKSVFKLAHGKFVAPQALEQLYETLPLVNQCWVTGETWAEYTVAVVVVSHTAAELVGFQVSTGQAKEGANSDMQTLEKEVLSSMIEASSASGIPSYQQPRGVIIELEPWTTELGVLTGTQKIKRPVLERRYKSRIKSLYDRLSDMGLESLSTSSSVPSDNVDVSSMELGDRIEDRINRIIAQVACLDPQDSINSTLSSVLPDSLAALRAIGLINRDFGTDLPVTTLLEVDATITSVADRIVGARTREGVSAIDTGVFLRDAHSSDDLVPAQTVEEGLLPETSTIHVALLTGSTGFVGIFLLVELLRSLAKDSTVYCIVRAPTIDEGVRRMEHQLTAFVLLDAAEQLSWRSRVVVVTGDLQSPCLGLDRETWTYLTHNIDLIVHCGAHVNSLLPYSALRDANVKGTAEIVRLACARERGTCFLCHISTVGVLPPSRLSPLQESSPVSVAHLHNSNGYAQSKWVAETLVRRAFTRGLSGCVIRPATVFCDSVSGLFNSTDFLVRALRGMAVLGVAPFLATSIRADVTPVDELVRVTIALCCAKEHWQTTSGRVLNLSSGQRPMSWLIEKLVASGGSRIKIEPWHLWQTALHESVHEQSALDNTLHRNPLHPLVTFFSGQTFPGAISTSTAESAALLVKCGITPPRPVSEDTIKHFFEQLQMQKEHDSKD